MSIFKLPDLGEGLPDAVVREWYVAEGDDVKVDQPLVAMETAKALVDVPSPSAGKIDKLHGAVGDTINTGDPLVTFQSNKAETTKTAKSAATVAGVIETSDKVIASENPAIAVAVRPASTQTTLATPLVRMLAKQLGVDLSQLKPAGDHITTEEVKVAAGIGLKKPQPTKQKITFTGNAIPLTQVRRAMVNSMVASHQEIVPVTLTDDANIQSWVGKQDMTIRIIKALVAACKQEPMLNSFFAADEQVVYQQPEVNIGLAVDTPEGLYVPVMKDVGNRDDASLREQINQFKEQAKTRSFPAADLKGATILLSNFGTFAGKYASPILVSPLVTIVGVGRGRDEVVPVNGKPAVARILPLSVTSDHRAVTGGELSRFLATLIESLTAK